MTDMVIMINQIFFFYGIGASLLTMLGMEAELKDYAVFLLLLQMWLCLMRKAAGKLFLLLGGHLLAAVVCIGSLQLGWTKLEASYPFFVAASVIITLFSMFVRLFPGWALLEKPGIYQLILLALFWALDAYAGKAVAQEIVYWCFAGGIICMLLHRNLIQTEQYIMNYAPSTKLDRGRLRRMNNLTSLAYAAVLGICFFIASMFQPDGAGRKLLEAIRSFLKWLLSFAPDGMANRATEWETEQLGPGSMAEGGMPPAGESSLLGKIIDQMIYYGGILLAIAFLLFMVISIFILAYRFFYQKKKPEGGIEEYAEPIRTRAVKRKRKTMEERTPWRSPAKRIRRMYKRSMRYFWGRSGYAPGHLVPAEQIRFLREHEAELRTKKAWFYAMTDEEQEEFWHLYEKARYSGEQVTEADVSRMDQLLHKM